MLEYLDVKGLLVDLVNQALLENQVEPGHMVSQMNSRTIYFFKHIDLHNFL